MLGRELSSVLDLSLSLRYHGMPRMPRPDDEIGTRLLPVYYELTRSVTCGMSELASLIRAVHERKMAGDVCSLPSAA